MPKKKSTLTHFCVIKMLFYVYFIWMLLIIFYCLFHILNMSNYTFYYYFSIPS
ncbi:uncharacterized protein BX663DRAFT_507022 [Cokeromyces recurvatus]|uniref:uncharacterized protein n=1 Tax=Cokeromyces recurvatus TaxID=90255 RepID=UPI00221E7964|nr:uncharacterized protein BX663DRAFT_507022 [Cokeromyces recurvatus]KAI7903593.1 hypothetical protein BX663DRAFT_507022 [Cokeromyces recurvatus]